MLDHDYIHQHDLVDRYLSGRLLPEELERFEAHFIDCQACLEELELAEDFTIALRDAAAEDAARALSQVVAATPRWRWFRPLAVAVPLTLAAAWLAWEAQQLSSGIAEQGERLAALEERFETGQATGPSQPLVNVPGLLLTAFRSAPGESAAPPILELGEGTEWVELSVEVDAGAEVASFQVALQRPPEEAPRWRRTGLLPDRYEALKILFPASLLPPGDYVLEVEEMLRDRRRGTRVRYPFRIAG